MTGTATVPVTAVAAVPAVVALCRKALGPVAALFAMTLPAVDRLPPAAATALSLATAVALLLLLLAALGAAAAPAAAQLPTATRLPAAATALSLATAVALLLLLLLLLLCAARTVADAAVDWYCAAFLQGER